MSNNQAVSIRTLDDKIKRISDTLLGDGMANPGFVSEVRSRLTHIEAEIKVLNKVDGLERKIKDLVSTVESLQDFKDKILYKMAGLGLACAGGGAVAGSFF